MPINFNGTNIEKIIYNGIELDKVIYNGVVVWESFAPVYLTVEGIIEGISFEFDNRNKYEVKIEIALDFDYGDIRTLTIGPEQRKAYAITGLSGGYTYEYEVFYYVNGESKDRDYGEVDVLKKVGPDASDVHSTLFTGNHDTGQCFVRVYNESNFEIQAKVVINEGSYYEHKETLTVAPNNWTNTLKLDLEGGSRVDAKIDYYYNGQLFETEKKSGYIDESSTTTYSLGEPTSSAGNFKYYSGDKK